MADRIVVLGGGTGGTVVANRAQEATTFELGTRGTRGFARWDLSLYHAAIDDELAGFVYSAPDLNQVLHAMRGRSVEEHMPEFQQRWAAIDHGVLLIIGVININ